jgi:hypothetical protein
VVGFVLVMMEALERRAACAGRSRQPVAAGWIFAIPARRGR